MIQTKKLFELQRMHIFVMVIIDNRYNSHGMPAGPFVADIHSREIVQSLHTIPKEYLINT